MTVKTGTLETARLLFADDVVAAIFTRAAGVQWADVTKDEMQKHVGDVQKRIEQAVTAFVRFANPALMEHMGRAISAGPGGATNRACRRRRLAEGLEDRRAVTPEAAPHERRGREDPSQS